MVSLELFASHFCLASKTPVQFKPCLSVHSSVCWAMESLTQGFKYRFVCNYKGGPIKQWGAPINEAMLTDNRHREVGQMALAWAEHELE